MTPAEIALLRDVIEQNKPLRPIGDLAPAKGLQSAGMAVLTYLDERSTIRVTPTQQGRRWHALASRAESKPLPHDRASVLARHRA